MFYIISSLFGVFLGVIYYIFSIQTMSNFNFGPFKGCVCVCDGMSDIVIILFRVFSFDYCSSSTGVGIKGKLMKLF